MKVYFIKHKITNLYFPDSTGRLGRGGSHTEPDQEADSENIRLFRSILSASRFLSAWCRGKFTSIRYYDGDYYEEDLHIEKIEDRNYNDYVIVMREINL